MIIICKTGKIIKSMRTHKCIIWWAEEDHYILGRAQRGGGVVANQLDHLCIASQTLQCRTEAAEAG